MPVMRFIRWPFRPSPEDALKNVRKTAPVVGRPTYHCMYAGVHVVPFQVMIGQMMRSSGVCIYCGRDITATTADPVEGKYP